jgi:hypothetical protein
MDVLVLRNYVRKSPWNQTDGETGMNFIKGVANRMGIVGELCLFFWQRKWWWLTPMILVLLLFGGVIIFAQSGAIAPFVYTLF